MTAYPVWDLPTRFIHWCFPIGIGLLWWTGETERMEWHSYVGYTLVVLVTTRLVWGFTGSFHSRFANFVRGPVGVFRYVQGANVRDANNKGKSESVGHNPLGAYSTLALLACLLMQGVSGMFSIDDVVFDGPLAYYFEGDYIDLASQLHEIGWNILQALVALHLVAIVWYQFKKRQPLVQAMWLGAQPGKESMHRPVGAGQAILIATAAAATLAVAIGFAPDAPSYY